MKGKIIYTDNTEHGPVQRVGILISEKDNLLIKHDITYASVYNIPDYNIGREIGEVEIPDELFEKLMELHKLQLELNNVDGEFAKFFKDNVRAVMDKKF